ncbi:hypothetical protein V6N12_055263 [Hibiscus sabdariffa]|uniref:Uncharacterized protein n=1 Tax=Hibiscus sabdariffa TaxID=183260 RepID=A0ABR2AWS1_9ROSI
MMVSGLQELPEQQRSDATQLARAQAEVVHMRMRHLASTSDHPAGTGSTENKLMASQSKSFYYMDTVDQANKTESLWSY